MAWLTSVAICIALLGISSRYPAGFVLKLAVTVIGAGMLLVTLVGLALRELQIKPSHAVITVMMQLLMTVIAIALFNIMNLVSRGMVNTQGAFHRRYNARNLNRFPVSLVIGEASQITRFATGFWGIGSAIILYATWFKMAV